MTRILSATLALTLTILILPASADQNEDRKALSKLQVFVGSWKGVGRAKPGTAKGAWSETASWSWGFSKDRAFLTYSAKKGRYFVSGKMSATKDGFQFEGMAPEAKEAEVFTGQLNKKGELVLSAEKTAAGRPTALTFKTVAGGDRLVVRYERKIGTSTRLARLAEIGFTRKGSGFGKGAGGTECIVTGGKGDMPVTHKGKTYYVCCGGCKDLFAEDPEGCLKDWAKRKAKEKAAEEEEDEEED